MTELHKTQIYEEENDGQQMPIKKSSSKTSNVMEKINKTNVKRQLFCEN